nr:MAG TPA: hypothetical protein [Bacteriophage sp.]DAT54395.1 MAG TPA: hypothetical protein [Caudoviricetes sp.]
MIESPGQLHAGRGMFLRMQNGGLSVHKVAPIYQRW